MTPKYKKIIDFFIKEYNNNNILPGDTVPSENELMKRWNCSRDTVRKAMTLLAERKYIQKNQGQKSTVLNRKEYEFPVSRITSFQELVKKRKLNAFTEVVKFETVTKSHPIYNLFKVPKSEKILEIIRIRKIDNEKIILDKDFFLEKYIGNLNKEIASGSIYEYLENELGLRIGFAKKTITVEKPTEEDKRYLDLKEDTLIANIESFTHLENDILFQITYSRHRSDKFKFIDFAQR
ncbi:MAG: trehalose operon repressor [Miniphocaeibacter sp.]|uniref:trehalose operon repressor n=1 Tax=Miniphocaeibacter sp. TaxID=3100973 RepID=UPI0017D8E2AD|nr:trehalose operon repressor [Gallicola sp.]